MNIAITGANSSVGQSLLQALAEKPQWQVNAGARSQSALTQLPQAANIHPRTIDYGDPDKLAGFLQNADSVVHLAGILIPTAHSDYQSANVDATAAVVDAAVAAGVKHIIFISVIGADEKSANSYFRSKGAAELVILGASVPATVIRTPILLGPTTAGARSLLNSAATSQTRVLGGGNYEMRPLDTGDLVQAVLNCCQRGGDRKIYELVGPEAISYRDLIAAMAAKQGRTVTVKSAPIALAKCMAAIFGLVRRGGITPTVIDVITKDERVDKNAAAELGVSLTPLPQTLDKILKAQP
ncbi:MAG: NAD(P)H-binding protein [Gammaproteobacteria bacterium]